jgi:hypothetical protein
MALNDIIFIKGQGGLGRPLEGEDYISGLLFYNDSLPLGFTGNVKSLGSLGEAEAAGIVNDYSDANAATSVIYVDDKGNDEDTVTITVDAINELSIVTTYNLGTYTKINSDSTLDLVAASIRAMINAGTYNHGFSASGSTNEIIIAAPKRFGMYLNGSTPNIEATGDLSVLVDSNFSGGSQSYYAIYHYHISEFFRVQPKGQLYVGIYEIPNVYTFEEIRSMQDYADGKIRQLGVWIDQTFSSSHLTAIQSHCTYMASVHKPLSAIYAGNIIATMDLTTLTNLATLTANNVSAVIGQDGAGVGNYLFVTQAMSISCLGATLGAVAYSKVSDDIAWISKFNMSSGSELDTINFANGQAIKTTSQSQLNTLDNYRYIFLIKYVGIAGSYFNDSHCAVTVQSDYAYIENNRTIDKAIRGVYASLLPNLNSPLVLNADGTLQDTTVAYFTSQAGVNLDEMVRQTELSAFQVLIDPRQNVLSTSTLVVSIKLVPIGVARNIIVNIGFALAI